MDLPLYILARTVVGTLQRLPLKMVARLGRAGGLLFYWVDGRHRRVAMDNLTRSFPEKSPGQIRELARENFKRIGENFCSAAKTASMTPQQIRKILDLQGLEKIPNFEKGFVGAVGHFGNFELYARLNLFAPSSLITATTYRGLRQPRVDRLLQQLRAHSGCLFFERRRDAARLKATMAQGGVALGLLSDQHAGKSGMPIPFFGRPCATTTAPAVFALRYKLPLPVLVCFRVGLGRWRIEVVELIPTEKNGRPRPVAEILEEINQCFEQAIRKDPANWFWVHNRWKNPADRNRSREATAAPVPEPVTDSRP